MQLSGMWNASKMQLARIANKHLPVKLHEPETQWQKHNSHSTSNTDLYFVTHLPANKYNQR